MQSLIFSLLILAGDIFCDIYDYLHSHDDDDYTCRSAHHMISVTMTAMMVIFAGGPGCSL